LESNIYYSYEDGVDENGDPMVLSGNVSTLHTIVENLDTDHSSESTRITRKIAKIGQMVQNYHPLSPGLSHLSLCCGKSKTIWEYFASQVT